MTLVFHTGEGACDKKYFTEEYVVISRLPIRDAVYNYSIEQFALPMEEIRDEAEKYRLSFTANNKLREYHSFVDANFNNFYNHVCLESYKWLNTYNNIKGRYEIDNFIITDAHRNLDYVAYYGAEGETNGSLFYKQYDLVSNIIRKALRGNNVKIDRMHSSTALFCRIVMRRLGLLSIKALLSFKSSFKRSDNKQIVFPEYLFLSRGLAHTHYVLPYIEEYNDGGLYVTSGYHAKESNEQYCLENGIDSILGRNYLKPIDVVVQYFVSLKLLLLKSSVKFPEFTYRDLRINMNSVMKEFIVSSFDANIYSTALSRFIEKRGKNIKALITGEMLTIFPYHIAQIAKKYKLYSIQLQTTLMAHKPQTKFAFCDKFLFKSSSDLESNINMNAFDADKYDFWGVMAKDRVRKKNDSIKKILFFTQPIEKDSEIEIVNRLVDYCNNNGISLVLKPHPRDDNEYINRWSGKVNIISKDLNIDNYIEDIDVVIMRNSSIAQEVIIKNIPIIYCLFTDRFSLSKSSHIDRSYIGVCNDHVDLLNLLDNNTKLKDEFLSYRERIMTKLSLNKSLLDFHKALEKII